MRIEKIQDNCAFLWYQNDVIENFIRIWRLSMTTIPVLIEITSFKFLFITIEQTSQKHLLYDK